MPFTHTAWVPAHSSLLTSWSKRQFGRCWTEPQTADLLALVDDVGVLEEDNLLAEPIVRIARAQELCQLPEHCLVTDDTLVELEDVNDQFLFGLTVLLEVDLLDGVDGHGDILREILGAEVTGKELGDLHNDPHVISTELNRSSLSRAPTDPAVERAEKVGGPRAALVLIAVRHGG